MTTNGAIALLGAPESTKAVNIQKGSDYFVSPAGQSGVLFPNGIGKVPLKGVPLLGLGPMTDTVVQRQQDAFFDDPIDPMNDPITGDGILERTQVTIPIEVTQLSLANVAPVPIQGFNYDILVTLDERDMDMDGQRDNLSVGTMTFFHNFIEMDDGMGNTIKVFDDSGATQGTFDSEFKVFYKVEFMALNGGPDLDDFFGSSPMSQVGAHWSHEPGDLPESALLRGKPWDKNANCHDTTGPGCAPTDFFIPKEIPDPNKPGSMIPNPVTHKDLILKHTTVISLQAVPEPLTILGSATAVGFGAFFKRKIGKKRDKQDKS